MSLSTLPFTPLGDRVVIKADRDDRAPAATDTGVYLAKTLAAAVDGSDEEDSWFVGTVVGVGPLVNFFDCRKFVLRSLKELICPGSADSDINPFRVAVNGLPKLIADIEALPKDCPDPIRVGDRVTFSWASGQQITVDGDKYLIMSTKDVLAVLEADEVETI